jgi:PKHD-type hydroxylase
MDEVEKVRKSDIHFFSRDDNTGWIFDRFNYVIDSLNEQFFGFNLNGYENIQYTVYESDVQGKYDYHIDCNLSPIIQRLDEMRKLSLVMLLNEPVIDFSGGELQLKMSDIDQTTDMYKGRIIAFPSFVLHRVKPVYLGIRKSLVIWVEGPKFL